MESEVPFYLVLEVFDQIHVGELWTPWQYCDCVIVKPFDYWLVGMIWVVNMLEHPLLDFFPNFIIDMLNVKKNVVCLEKKHGVICYGRSLYSQN